jgi:hypothetical protein
MAVQPPAGADRIERLLEAPAVAEGEVAVARRAQHVGHEVARQSGPLALELLAYRGEVGQNAHGHGSSSQASGGSPARPVVSATRFPASLGAHEHPLDALVQAISGHHR